MLEMQVQSVCMGLADIAPQVRRCEILAVQVVWLHWLHTAKGTKEVTEK